MTFLGSLFLSFMILRPCLTTASFSPCDIREKNLLEKITRYGYDDVLTLNKRELKQAFKENELRQNPGQHLQKQDPDQTIADIINPLKVYLNSDWDNLYVDLPLMTPEHYLKDVRDPLWRSETLSENENLKALHRLTQGLKTINSLLKPESSLKTPVQNLYLFYKKYLEGLKDTPAKSEKRAHYLQTKYVVQGTDFLPRRISKTWVYKTLGLSLKTGLPLEKTTEGAHSVYCHEGIYFKRHSGSGFKPSEEFKVYALYKELNIDIPPTTLLHYAGAIAGEKQKNFIVQASYGIRGQPLYMFLMPKELQKKYMAKNPEPWTDEEQTAIDNHVTNCFETLDHDSFCSQFIGALLTNPTDGKGDNYMAVGDVKTSWKIVPIDNDHVQFAYEKKEKYDQTLPCWTVLYMFSGPLETPLSEALCQYLKDLSPPQIIIKWLKALETQNQNYVRLQKEAQTIINENQDLNTFAQKWSSAWNEDTLTPMSIPISLQKKDVSFLYNRLKELQILSEHNPPLSPKQLLTHFDPAQEHIYQKWRRQTPDTFFEHKDWSQGFEKQKVLSPRKALELFIKQEMLKKPQTPRLKKEFLESLFRYYPQNFETLVKIPNISQTFSIHEMILENLDIQAFKSLYQNQDGFSQIYENPASPCHHLLPLDIAFKNQSHAHIRYLLGKTPEIDEKIAYEFWQMAPLPNILKSTFERVARKYPKLWWKITIDTLFPKDKKGTFFQGCDSGKRHLNPQGYDQVFDAKGKFKRWNTHGRSDVARLSIDGKTVFIKRFPEIPGYEYATYRFMERLGFYGSPISELFLYNQQGKAYPVLISQALDGVDIATQLHEDKTFSFDKHIDPVQTANLIVTSFLLNFEDAKEDNWILVKQPASEHPYKLMAIDTDHVFVPSAIKKKSFFVVKDVLQIKNFLYVLEHMKQAMPQEVVDMILRQDPSTLLFGWFQDLKQREDQQRELFNKYQARIVHHTDPLRKTVFNIPIPPYLPEEINRKLSVGLQRYLQKTPQSIPNYLLGKLDPYVYKHYNQAIKLDLKNSSVHPSLEKFSAICNGLFKNSKKTSTAHETPSTSGSIMKVLRVQAEDIMDIEKIKSILNGPSLALTATENIKSVPLQRWMVDCRHLPAPELTLEQGLAQKDLEVLQIKFAGQKVLPLNKIIEFIENSQQLKILDLTGCDGLNGGPTLPALEKLTVDFCKNLKQLKGNFPNLKWLSAENCDFLSQVQITAPHLRKIKLSSRSLKTLEITSEALERIRYNEKSLSPSEAYQDFFKRNHAAPKLKLHVPSLDLSNCDLILKDLSFLAKNHPNLRVLNLDNNNLDDDAAKVLGTGNLKNLTSLDLRCNRIGHEGAKAIAESQTLKNLISLSLSSNRIGEDGAISLSNSKNLLNLTSLDFSDNDIGDEGVMALANSKYLTNLTSLNLESNRIEEYSAMALAESAYITKLISLSLSSNRIGEDGAISLSNSKNLSDLTSLDFSNNNIGDEGAMALANSKYLTNLTSLNLESNRIKEGGAMALANSKYLTNLTSLNLESNRIEEYGAMAMAESAYITKLTSLSLSFNRIGEDGAIALSNSKNLSDLTSLDFSNNNIGDEGAIALAESAYITKLTSLSLSFNRIGEDGAISLAESAYITKLTSLSLSFNRIGEDGAIALSNSKYLSDLTSLDFSNNNIGDEGAMALANSKYLTNLTSLNLESNRIKEGGAMALANSKYLTNLTSLNLKSNGTEEYEAMALAESAYITKLTSLSLSSNRIGDEGAMALANSKYLTNLTSLNLGGNKIGHEGAKAIAGSPTLSLTSLDLANNRIEDEGVKAIATSQTLKNLTSLHLERNVIGSEGELVLENMKRKNPQLKISY